MDSFVAGSWGSRLPILNAHTFLVEPGKNIEPPPAIDGQTLSLSGDVFDLLNGIYNTSDTECDVGVQFKARSKDDQENDCRDLILAYVTNPNLNTGKKIAHQLQKATDRRSGDGLLFLIYGTEGKRHKFIVSRFPTETAIRAAKSHGKLNIEYLKEVFMKSKTSYKAAVYQDTSTVSGSFWTGHVVDRQSNAAAVDASRYWINEFLLSEFLVTAAFGTRRLASALAAAAKISDSLNIKNQIASVVSLAAAFDGKTTSVVDLLDHYGIEGDAAVAIGNQFANSRTMKEKFKFSADEFKKHVGFKFVELDNGAMLSAAAAEFDEIFEQEEISGKGGKTRFSTIGKVTDERVGGSGAKARVGGKVPGAS